MRLPERSAGHYTRGSICDLHFTPTEPAQKELKPGGHCSVQELERDIRARLARLERAPTALRLDEDN
ncbi:MULTISPECIES: hypothetical protein [unclassified Streptomyces]|uniref:hypothetical protein n=1 Tax=unclassified Streptomyces TaxID=2593676 RepID=UPI002E2D89B1|nr:hypothetical protein [Streptomyces sp. NBC_00273]